MIKYYSISIVLILAGIIYLSTQNEAGIREIFYEKWLRENFTFLYFKYRITKTNIPFLKFCKGIFTRRINFYINNPRIIKKLHETNPFNTNRE